MPNPLMPPKSKGYRPDIDGLRAVAVLSVVFYHAQLSLFSGGFVGVDIFFVISGYLITSIIHREFSEHRFSFLDFYFRRIRRIFPALYVMIFFTMAMGFFLLFPRDFLQLGRAAKYIAFFSSNHLFWHTQNDYWAQNLKSAQPLLHTWSLAVEEQFYIFVPCLLAAMFLFFKRRKVSAKKISLFIFGLFSLISIVSLLYSQKLLAEDPSGAFYLLTSRAWELLIGSLLAVGISIHSLTYNRSLPRCLSEVSAWTGLGLIGWGVFSYSHDTTFPGLHALAPCFGAALIIFSGHKPASGLPLVNRILSTSPFVFVGLLSYSLYLWHWPVFIFARAPHWAFWGFKDIPLWLQLIVTMVLTLLSWRIVEEPFKHWKTTKKNQYLTLGFALVTMVVLSMLGTFAIKTTYVGAEFPQPIPAALLAIAPIEKFPFEKWQASMDVDKIAVDGGGVKLGSGAPTFAVLGDSFGAMWGEALNDWAPAHGSSGFLFARTGCPPLDGLGSYSKPECEPATKARYEYLKTSPVKKIVLIGAWGNIFFSGKESFYDSTEKITRPKKREYGSGSLLFITLERTIQRLTSEGYQLYVMDIPVGDPTGESPYGPAIESMNRGGEAITFPLETLEKDSVRAEIHQTLVELQGKYKFTLLEPTRVLCVDGKCLIAQEGFPINYDYGGHLTPYGSKKSVSIFTPILEK
jgi:peptidoglycan/LPS O-acetylase OafA/YrhL